MAAPGSIVPAWWGGKSTLNEQTRGRTKSKVRKGPPPPKKRASGPPPVASVLKIADTTLGDLTDVFKLLADKNRLRIVLLLAQEGRMHVTALCDMLAQSQPAVSHHLTLMRMVGLVDYERVGKNNYYYLASEHLRNLLEQFFTDVGDGNKTLVFEGFDLAFRRT
jgi:ArsR family transcriptional regulator